MGRTANLSPLGLYEWDNTVFSLMQIPEALDRDVLVKNLLAQTAELEVLYPNPVVFKNLVALWSAKEIDVWNRLYATTQYEYNPIENYNRYETQESEGSDNTMHTGTDSTTNSELHTGTDRGTRNRTRSGADTTTTTGSNGHWIAGFNSMPSGDDDGLVKQTRDESSGTETIAYNSGEDEATTFTHGETISNTTNLAHGENVHTERDGSYELHAHGNIGVTTTQKLIREQRDIDLFNLYDIIIESFKMRFCILVY